MMKKVISTKVNIYVYHNVFNIYLYHNVFCYIPMMKIMVVHSITRHDNFM